LAAIFPEAQHVLYKITIASGGDDFDHVLTSSVVPPPGPDVRGFVEAAQD
jgi:hypothetical protein